MAQMEVSYSRRLDYQYMMIETGGEARSDYRLSMLINNRINGFLPVHVQQMNGKSTLSYEITSLENLPEFLDARKITYDEMVSLLLQFCSAVSEAGRYLLDGEGILLEPQYIYVSKSLERIRFCYYPYQHMPLHQSVNVLCRFLIDHIDYDDRRSLELAYGLFQESLRENLSISVIVGCIKDRLENATNDYCDSGVSSVQTSSQLNKQITNQECKQSDFKQTDIGAGEQETQQEKQHKNVQQVSDSPKKEKTKCKKKKSAVTVIGILLIIVILGYVFFTAGKRLLLLDLINKNLLAAAGIFIVAAAVAAAFMAYWILKPKH
ncbi:DUF6382 domain-containing protein [Lachnoclostridium sp. 210928-DFI.6.3]|nr:DUF6382 domain-containing protein [Lachnoclostridium sp. 210928-DFI.6.3]